MDRWISLDLCMAFLLACGGSSPPPVSSTDEEAGRASVPDQETSTVEANPSASESDEEVLQAIAPFVADGRASYPRARDRFLAGLPENHHFLIFTRLTDSERRAEFVFVLVARISAGVVAGTIASPTRALKGYAQGDAIEVPESDVLDWVISKPDGTEEGNVVARFLNYWRSGEFYGAVFGITVATTGEVQVSFHHMMDRRAPSVPANFSPPSVFLEAATEYLQRKAWPKATPGKEFFTYLLFWPLDPTNVTKEPPKK